MNDNQKLLTWMALIVMIGTLCFAPWEMFISNSSGLSATAKEEYSAVWKPPTQPKGPVRVRLRTESLLIELAALGLIYCGLFATFQSRKKD